MLGMDCGSVAVRLRVNLRVNPIDPRVVGITICSMRTTILLDDELGERLRARARQEGKSFSAFLADAGRKALDSHEEPEVEPFELITFLGDGSVEDVDLDRTNQLLVAEDVATYAGLKL